MKKHPGFILFTVVALLLLLTIITLTATQTGVLENRLSRNRYESETTFLENENAILKTTSCFLGQGQSQSASAWCQKVLPSKDPHKTLSSSDAPLMKTDEGLVEKYVLQFLDFEKSAPKPVIVMPSPAKAAAPATAIEVPVAVWKKEQNKNGAVKDPQKFCPAQATCTTATIFPSPQPSDPNNPLPDNPDEENGIPPYGYAIIAGKDITVAESTPSSDGSGNPSGDQMANGGNDAKTTIAASVFYTGSLDKSLTVDGSAIKGSIKCGNNPEESYCLPELEKIQDKNFLKQYIEALQKKYPDRVHINEPLPGADSGSTEQNKDGPGSGLPNSGTSQSGQTNSGAFIDLKGQVYYYKDSYTLPEGKIFYNGTIISERTIIASASGGFCPGDEPIVDQGANQLPPLNLIAAGNIEYHLPAFAGTMVAGGDVRLGSEVLAVTYPAMPPEAPRLAAWRRDYHLQDK